MTQPRLIQTFLLDGTLEGMNAKILKEESKLPPEVARRIAEAKKRR